MLKIAFIAVVPVYAAVGWIIRTSAPERPAVIPPGQRTIVFAVLCVVGFASAAASVILRRSLAFRPAPDPGSQSTKALLVGMALAESPALLGLVYYFLTWDPVGFAILLVASFAAFALHLIWNP